MKSQGSVNVGRAKSGAMLGVTVAAFALLAAACGSSGTKTSTAPPAASPTTTATTASTATTTAQASVASATSSKLGAVLVDAKGMTLYTFDPENAGGIKCTTGCVDNWPPDLLPSGTTTPTPGAGVTVSLATITRPDGTVQVTAGGHPLYTFAADKAPGDTNGDGVGGKWHAARPTAAAAPAASAPANVTTTTAYKY
jgi:predicted lipoprotein with Yx(FWY)xxD motif